MDDNRFFIETYDNAFDKISEVYVLSHIIEYIELEHGEILNDITNIELYIINKYTPDEIDHDNFLNKDGELTYNYMFKIHPMLKDHVSTINDESIVQVISDLHSDESINADEYRWLLAEIVFENKGMYENVMGELRACLDRSFDYNNAKIK
jgi:hypothetical protein